ncbi:MAG: 3-hydroxyacyl-CoA dehydrogenase [Paracoccus denitrificans]|nr:MAG: 3-hydroxyacyl-CoA dehydrogenase [Paracoccus denitrificans]PZO84272.1 MAG: 3-hydroxyacyl-CoA dehydrogenase [Paracoccus denitrificans]
MTVSYETRGGIAVVTIDNPPVNAMSHAIRRDLTATLDRFIADDDAAAMVLRCAGRTFVAGADVREFGQPPQPPFLPDLISAIEAAPKPVIAALHGTALGGGLELALGAHYRIASDDAQMGLPEVTLGVLPGAGGTQRLPRVIGVLPAAEAITSSRRLTATEARDLGLVDKLVPKDQDLTDAAVAFAKALVADGAGPRPVSAMPVPAFDPAALAKLRDTVTRKARGQVAPIAALDALEEGLSLPFADGLANERTHFRRMIESPQRPALTHAFFSERKAIRPLSLKGVTARPVSHVAIIGGGTMGTGIATAALIAGLTVTLVEAAADRIDHARGVIDQNLRDAVARGKLSSDDCQTALTDRLTLATGLDATAPADLIIEAVFEKMALKQSIFAELDRVAKPGAVLATNTSYLDVDAIAAATDRPQDVLGLHFFSPAHVMRLLEIVVGAQTAPEVVATAFAFAARIGKIGVRAGVCDGFIGNRILSTYRAAMDAMVLDGASPYQIDRALVGFGMAMGPYRTADLSGLDVGYMNRQSRQATRHPRDRVPVHADRMVELGRLGRKSGTGYYIYDAASPNGREDPELDPILRQIRAELGITPRDFSDAEIVSRFMAAMVNEGAKVLDDGIAERASDIDVVLINGYGFPRYLGGPMFWADQTGLGDIARQIGDLARQDDHFWTLSPLLARLAKSGGSFAAHDKELGSE